MMIAIAGSLAFAALFVTFALLGVRHGQAGCHGCTSPDEHPECGANCPLIQDAERTRWESNA